MSSKVLHLFPIFMLFLFFVNCEFNVQYKVESSYNDTEQGVPIPEVIEQGENTNFEDTAAVTDGGLMTSPPVVTEVTPNITTKRTWIQRIPKKTTKPNGYKGKKKENFPQIALEVVIGQRIKAINNMAVLYRYDELEDELGIFFGQNYFNYANALRRRGSVLQMGCDYLVQNNKTHLTSNLVCVYGVLYFSNGLTNDYSTISGTSCSKCDFYSKRPYIRSRNGSLPWGCLSTFAFLCGDLVVSPDPVADFRYSCNGTPTNEPTPPTVDLDTVEIAEKSNLTEATESPPHNWPCLKYAIPIVLVTSVMVAIVLHQVYSIISIKLRSN